MLGSLRFALALLVAFSHMGMTPHFHFGSMAVMVFYLIAGYVMAHSFCQNFGASLARAPAFYADRLLRVYPLYAVSLLLILAFVTTTGYGKLYLDPRSTLVNLTMIQLNDHGTIMNPATWSLGTELQFYLLLPFLVRFPALKYALLPISYGVFIAATVGLIDPIRWGYKMLPGTLWLFIVGAMIYDAHRGAGSGRAVRWLVAVAAAHLVALSFFPKLIEQPYAFETLAGMLVGVTALTLLGRLPSNRTDDRLGRLSYPIFVGHVVILYAFDYARTLGFDTGVRGMVALQLAACIGLALPLAMLDGRITTLRRWARSRHLIAAGQGNHGAVAAGVAVVGR